MIFTELRFPVFFIVVLAVYWLLLRDERPRKLWLLAASYFFYAAWDWRFLSLILISTAVDYVVGLRLGATDEPLRRRWWVTLSICTNLGILGVFKYFNFFAQSAASLLSSVGLDASWTTLHIVLPVGISFYTFQTMSYSIDVYRRKLEPCRDLLDLALFVAFFPQLVAGPIVRAVNFLPQLRSFISFDQIDVRSALVVFLAGWFKKACVSDNIAPIVDRFFDAPLTFTAGSTWIAVALYAIQIYCDFSGYSDMAIGCARLLGFELGDNFRFPYLSGSIRDFWRRWHISLSSWLRDYLYISLGGNRGGRLATQRNLMLTMLLGGLWHGASWNFVIWGGLHGLALIVHRAWSASWGSRLPETAWRSAVGLIVTLYWIGLTWIFFRAETLTEGLAIARSYLTFHDMGSYRLSADLWILIAALGLLHVLAARSRESEWWQDVPGWAFASGYGLLVTLTLSLVRSGVTPFIYFQF